MLSNQIKIR